MPLVLRTKVAMGTGYGSQHSMDPAGIFATSVGWRILAPSTPFDYVGLMNSAIANLIRKNETNKIPSTIQTSRRHGMVTLDDYLLDLVLRDVITPEVALDAAQDRRDLETRLR